MSSAYSSSTSTAAPGRVAPGVRQRLLQDPVAHRGRPPAAARTAPLERQPHGRPGRTRRLHELVQACEARLRLSVGLRVRRPPQDAENAPHLAERVSRRVCRSPRTAPSLPPAGPRSSGAPSPPARRWPRRGARRRRGAPAQCARARPSAACCCSLSTIACRLSSRSATASPRWRCDSPSASAATTSTSSRTPGEPGGVAPERLDRVDEKRERE